MDVMPDQWWIGLLGVAVAAVLYMVRRDRDAIDAHAGEQASVTNKELHKISTRLESFEDELRSINSRIPSFATLEQVDARVAIVRGEMREDRAEYMALLKRIDDKLDAVIKGCALMHSRRDG